MKILKQRIKYSLRFIPDKIYLNVYYFFIHGKLINWKKPMTFNEKLNWLKLNDHKEIYVDLVDKYEAKRVVSNIIGEEYIIPTYGIWDTFDAIDFSKLPNRFVLKCTHDSGGVYVCQNKREADFSAMKKFFDNRMKMNYYYVGREWPYKMVKPRIIAEEMLTDDNESYISDYKLMCFNGKVEYAFVCTERNTKEGLKVTFFDREWNKMSFERKYPSSKSDIERPKQFSKMIDLAEVLAKNIPFVRIDFYEVCGKIYFGEYTLYPGNGMEKFSPIEWDRKLGELIKLG